MRALNTTTKTRRKDKWPKAKAKIRVPVVAKKEVKEIKKSIPEPEVKASIPEESGPKCAECGKPVAPGQNSVCKEHIRAG